MAHRQFASLRTCHVISSEKDGRGNEEGETSQYSSPIVGINELHPERLRPLLVSKAQQKRAAAEQQLQLDFGDDNP